MGKCPICGYWAFNGQECFDCGYRPGGSADCTTGMQSRGVQDHSKASPEGPTYRVTPRPSVGGRPNAY